MVVLVGQCRTTPLHPFLSILLPMSLCTHPCECGCIHMDVLFHPFSLNLFWAPLKSSDGATKDSCPATFPGFKGRPTLISFCLLYFDVFGSNDGQNNSQGFQHLGTAGLSSIFKWPKIWAEESTSSFRPLSGSFHLFSRVSFILYLNIVISLCKLLCTLSGQFNLEF